MFREWLRGSVRGEERRGKRQRLIVNARRSNEHFKSPSSVRLDSLEVLGKTETPTDSRGMRPTMYAASADVKDCFHSMETPK